MTVLTSHYEVLKNKTKQNKMALQVAKTLENLLLPCGLATPFCNAYCTLNCHTHSWHLSIYLRPNVYWLQNLAYSQLLNGTAWPLFKAGFYLSKHSRCLGYYTATGTYHAVVYLQCWKSVQWGLMKSVYRLMDSDVWQVHHHYGEADVQAEKPKAW